MHWGRGGPNRYMMGRRGDGGPGGPTMRGPGKTFAQLDLSDEQSVKPDALMELQHEEMQSLVKKSRGHGKRIDKGVASRAGRS